MKILLAVLPFTGPLERSFSELAKVYYKDRNSISSQNLQNLYILAVLKEPAIQLPKSALVRAGEIQMEGISEVSALGEGEGQARWGI